ncbi:MAG TPA: TadE/TadG family type IV pilus assembly protein [Nocardioides sp.]|nr:TadE/TadG family type IV pilus assembly protein [Nocardioides sp.]
MGRCLGWGRARARRDARGAAAVEFALIMPILLLLVFGIISYGYMLSFRQAISQAAAEGARAAAVAQVAGERDDDAVAAVNDALDSYGVTCADADGPLQRNLADVGTCSVVIAQCDGEPASVLCATVTIDYAYEANPLLPVPGVGIVLPDRLAYSAVARVS